MQCKASVSTWKLIASEIVTWPPDRHNMLKKCNTATLLTPAVTGNYSRLFVSGFSDTYIQSEQLLLYLQILI